VIVVLKVSKPRFAPGLSVRLPRMVSTETFKPTPFAITVSPNVAESNVKFDPEGETLGAEETIRM